MVPHGTLEDGSFIIIGGCRTGGFVNDPGQNNPTYEFYPSRGQPVHSPVLENTLPTNLFPLTWLLPSGKLLIQSNWQTILMDYKTQNEQPLDDMPAAVRTYPASAGTTMMPLTPSNNYTATIMFCGGSNVPTDQWRAPGFNAMETPTSASCVQITPDVSGKYRDVEPFPEPRVLTSLILLPDQTVLALNGARKGTAGYGNDTWAVGQSYADDPVLTPLIYDPKAAAGKQWSSDGFSPSTVPRMYHSSATLLPDGDY
ncbi:uncharacterized protein LACBIDRAFT_308210 [Laccaria bicolor S238N-H82]|uniref:Predicted protein n=1 Tax=Laccaria bicolor (strain S238N-H82 / ATCC MYA-4686) TaxID=486041 RepID=B0DRU9_LACBS|nr:uncharacterized protein LACBIDRAFT_308210 [Laccaria bicolor S238N-H82]EDR02674.1 predicted protein [Laccaria bicolor S238N-H82]|eukprot:XP_001886718.1 predicted protein [Laccaria bicolor S238N-H82]